MSNQNQIKRPLKGLSRSIINDDGTAAETAIPSQGLTVELPRDMYLHSPISILNLDGCPTEWWWHTGTLKTSTGRTFGFEINAAAFYPGGFTEVMLTDVEKQIHYQQTELVESISNNWAETDVAKPWFVNLNNVLMQTVQADPTQNMSVKATIMDTVHSKLITFDLTFSQEGAPLMVWGDGVAPGKGVTNPQLNNSNFYFSLTRMNAKGTIEIIDLVNIINTETLHVTGTTWMDHEWGKFGTEAKPEKWVFQAMQFDNGVCLSNFSLTQPVLYVGAKGKATVQLEKGGASYCVKSTITPLKANMIGGNTYFTELSVEIPDFGIMVVVKSLMPDQVFVSKDISSVYEGVASVSGAINDKENIGTLISGTAWIEQTF